MNDNAMKNLIESLKLLRSGADSEQNYRSVVNTFVEKLQGQLSPGISLKLRRGTLNDVMAITAVLVSGCKQCESLHPQATFNSRAEHATCAQTIDKALANHVLIRISRPAWVLPDATQLGADGYFLCCTCDSIWTLVEPEMHANGLWKRIA